MSEENQGSSTGSNMSQICNTPDSSVSRSSQTSTSRLSQTSTSRLSQTSTSLASGNKRQPCHMDSNTSSKRLRPYQQMGVDERKKHSLTFHRGSAGKGQRGAYPLTVDPDWQTKEKRPKRLILPQVLAKTTRFTRSSFFLMHGTAAPTRSLGTMTSRKGRLKRRRPKRLILPQVLAKTTRFTRSSFFFDAWYGGTDEELVHHDFP